MIEGYHVRIRENTDTYSSFIDVGNILYYDFFDLQTGVLYFAQVRAYDSEGNTSAWSNEYPILVPLS